MNDIIKTIIVDDEPLARGIIDNYISKTSFLEQVGEFSNAMDALEALRSMDIDLVFLDIQMPDMNGIELSHMLDVKKTKIIFTTAFSQYALEGFKADAVDYLLKPFKYAEFLHAAEKAKDRIITERKARSHSLSEMKSEQPVNIYVKSDYKMVQVRLDSIQYIESAKDYVIIHTSDDQKLMTQMTMKTMEEQLPGEQFIRVHRSYIVNIEKVKTIEQGFIPFGRVVVPISDSYKDHFFEALKRRSILL